LEIKDIERSHLLIVFKILIADLDVRCADHYRLGNMVIEYFVDQICCSGFPIGSRDSDNKKILGWISIHIVCELPHKSFPQLIDDTIFEEEIEFIVESDFFDE